MCRTEQWNCIVARKARPASECRAGDRARRLLLARRVGDVCDVGCTDCAVCGAGGAADCFLLVVWRCWGESETEGRRVGFVGPNVGRDGPCG